MHSVGFQASAIKDSTIKQKFFLHKFEDLNILNHVRK
jgi:hypothetical protein